MGRSDEISAIALRVHDRLLEAFGSPRLKPQRDPLSELVMTILSQNTSDTNSGRAWRSLQEQFPTWEDVRAADTSVVAEAIHSGGLANIKAPRIQHILSRLVDERDSLDLEFLRDMPVDEARRYLVALPGVGPKTAACVLLFSLHKPALPVDTHVHRVARRVGLFPEKTSAAKAHVLLEEMLPQEAYYPFHLNMIRLGRTICKASNPQCEACPLASDCNYARTQGAAI